MKDIFSNPFFQKIAMVLVAAGLYVAAARVPQAQAALEMLAAAITGGAIIPRPGDKSKGDDQ